MQGAELEAFVDGLAAEAMARDHIAGAVVVVVQNGQTALAKGYGVDRLSPARPVDPDRTLFRLGPVTETFTWALVMREVEAGHMRLDAPINQYLPQVDQVPDQGFAEPVRLRHLLSQSGGGEERRFGQLVETDPTLIRPLEKYLAEERPKRVRPPGRVAAYSSYAAALAGEALAQVTGKTPQALAEQQIFRPLGLAHTSLREPYPAQPGLPAPMDRGLAGDVSQGFRWTGSGLRPQKFEFTTQAAPAEAGSSTGEDMARYLMAILGDGTLAGQNIYSASIARNFRTPLLRSSPSSPAWDFGMLEYPLPGGYLGYGRDGGALSFRASLITVPKLGLGVFVAANTDTSGAFVRRAPAAIVQRFYAPPPAPVTGSQWLLDNASAFTGTYLNASRAYRGLEGFVDRFRGRAKVEVDRAGFLLTPGLTGLDRWIPSQGAATDAPFVTFRQSDGAGALDVQMAGGQAVRWFAPSGETVYERAGFFARRGLLALLAAATAIAALAALAGLGFRDRRDFRQTSIQARADGAQISASILWLVALACFGVFYLTSADPAALVADWPSAWLLIASACALVATLVTLLVLGLLPAAWQGGRRLDSWTLGRKARFSTTTAIFALFGILLGFWGALEPWSR
jgi:CubicO group peptidase (beta-lactamase class C family)